MLVTRENEGNAKGQGKHLLLAQPSAKEGRHLLEEVKLWEAKCMELEAGV